MPDHTTIVVGGGAYGCYAALKLAERDPGPISIIEREPELLQRASFHNQARVHNGYHYPRSLLTALRSRVNFPRFLDEFGPAISADFEKLYAIGLHRSKVTSQQFVQFCHRIGAQLEPAPIEVRRLLNWDLIEDAFLVREYAFDADRLRALLEERIAAARIEVLKGTEALSIERADRSGRLALSVRNVATGAVDVMHTGRVLNCTYSSLNTLLARSGLQTLFLRHEATEMALIELPDALRRTALTVMCGPFFSFMPFPPRRGLSTLSHVSYTPHYEWIEMPNNANAEPHRPRFPLASNFERMRRDAARFVPILAECRHAGSLWETKTILPQSDVNDSRPILFKSDTFLPNVISVLGGKIDNMFDLDIVLGRESVATERG
jgi:glycine/D-amino acid oxidase-like deaminating enzyme